MLRTRSLVDNTGGNRLEGRAIGTSLRVVVVGARILCRDPAATLKKYRRANPTGGRMRRRQLPSRRAACRLSRALGLQGDDRPQVVGSSVTGASPARPSTARGTGATTEEPAATGTVDAPARSAKRATASSTLCKVRCSCDLTVPGRIASMRAISAGVMSCAYRRYRSARASGESRAIERMRSTSCETFSAWSCGHLLAGCSGAALSTSAHGACHDTGWQQL